MPTYGYRCTACAHEFEVFQKMSDPPVASCEVCGAPVKKRLYPVGISFKGSGFYVNDYSKTASTSEASETSAPAKADTPGPAADAAASTKESTPATTADVKPAAPASTPTTS